MAPSSSAQGYGKVYRPPRPTRWDPEQNHQDGRTPRLPRVFQVPPVKAKWFSTLDIGKIYHQTFRWYLKWRNPHLYKLYGYGLCKGKPIPKMALWGSGFLHFRYLKLLGIIVIISFRTSMGRGRGPSCLVENQPPGCSSTVLLLASHSAVHGYFSRVFCFSKFLVSKKKIPPTSRKK